MFITSYFIFFLQILGHLNSLSRPHVFPRKFVTCLQSNQLGPVVQSIVSLTTSLRRQLVKYMLTKSSNTLLFFVEKMLESFSHFSNKK